MKKRLRLGGRLRVLAPVNGWKVFADEEAIETSHLKCGAPRQGFSWKVFADEEAIETNGHVIAYACIGRVGKYSLMKKRLRRASFSPIGVGKTYRWKVFADEEAIETSSWSS